MKNPIEKRKGYHVPESLEWMDRYVARIQDPFAKADAEIMVAMAINAVSKIIDDELAKEDDNV